MQMELGQLLQAGNPTPAVWAMLLDHLLWRVLPWHLRLQLVHKALLCVVHRSQQQLPVLQVVVHHG
jgi:hypothetical protein